MVGRKGAAVRCGISVFRGSGEIIAELERVIGVGEYRVHRTRMHFPLRCRWRSPGFEVDTG